MNYKAILITAIFVIALCAIPVSAVWMNGNWVTQEQYDRITDGATVVHNPGSDVTSKYRDTNPAKSTEVFVGANTCTLEGNVRAGYNTLTKEVLLANVLAPNDTMVIPILPDGTFRYEGLAQGNYTLKIVPQMEGLGPEQVSSVHCDHGVVRPESELNGYAITASGDNKCIPSYTIESAMYGLSQPTCHDVTVHHGDYSREWIDGYCAHYNKWGWCTDYRNGHYEYTNVGMGNGDYVKVRYHCCDYQYVAPTTTCVPDGTFEDVTSEVQQVVTAGHTSFLFNNAENPGGIFDITTTTLLSEISPDPAPGSVKDVIISYQNGCGMDTTITTKEYCTIDLAAGTATCPSQTT